MDADARIPAALQALGPVADRDVCVLDGADGRLAGQLLSLGGWIRVVPDASPASLAAIPDDRADVLVSGWSGFQPGSPDWEEQLTVARRVLRPDGRLLVVHDYGRDEVTSPFSDPGRAAERVSWSRPNGPFLGAGFRVRVLHCWWQWDTLAEATELLTNGFGDAGATVAAGMRRPRLAWKVAVYHLAMDMPEAVEATSGAATRAAKASKASNGVPKTPVAETAAEPAPRRAAPAAQQLASA